jgi:hypothetical protein
VSLKTCGTFWREFSAAKISELVAHCHWCPYLGVNCEFSEKRAWLKYGVFRDYSAKEVNR